jgi:hypothetical protein
VPQTICFTLTNFALAYEPQKRFDSVLRTRTEDCMFRAVTNHVNTSLQAFYVPALRCTPEAAIAAKYLDAGAYGKKYWRDVAANVSSAGNTQI